jgi:myo-inositol-1(or 4)-monophosphatase
MNNDLALISDAARAGGALALAHRAEGVEVRTKADGTPVTVADEAVDRLLFDTLTTARPDYGWLSEETADDPLRLRTARQFIVDPIDGTQAYLQGQPWYVISIAVVEDGQSVAGALYAPALDELYQVTRGGGATLNGAPIRASAVDRLEGAAMLGDAPMFADPRWPTPWPPMRIEARNAIAYRMALVASGAFDAAVSLSSKRDWDLAAATLLCREAGAVVTDHRGGELSFNSPRASVPSLICAAPGLHAEILSRTAFLKLPS